MKALIMSAPGVEDSELLVPMYRLLEEGLKVDVAAPKKGKFAGKHGIEFKANLAIEDAKAGDYDVLVLPGGHGAERVRIEKQALTVTRKVFEAGKPVAAICHGPQVLMSAGVLDGRKATCYKTVVDDLKAAGATFEDKEVVVDGNLVTSRSPDDLPAFCRELVKLVKAAK